MFLLKGAPKKSRIGKTTMLLANAILLKLNTFPLIILIFRCTWKAGSAFVCHTLIEKVHGNIPKKEEIQ